MPYDPLKDFMPITMVNSAPLLLVVHPSIAAKSVTELIAYAKAHPGQLNYGSGGLGSTPYLAAELFKSLSGDVVHVPYKGGSPALSDLVGGQLSFMIENMPGTMPYAKAGSLRALAITSPQRSQLAPELPTMAEAGVLGYEMSGWNGIFAVKGTPPEIVVRLNSEVANDEGVDLVSRCCSDPFRDAVPIPDRDHTVITEPCMIRGARQTDDLGADIPGQLHGNRAYTARGARDDDGVGCLQRNGLHRRISRGSRDKQSPCLLPRDMGGAMDEMVSLDDNQLGLTGTIVSEADDLVADRDILDRGADLLDDARKVAALLRETSRATAWRRRSPGSLPRRG
jgi:hypothetical protein